MNHIIVIGSLGSGKSYFSKKLAQKLNIPLFHMDNIYWIIDGNYISTIEQRIKGADPIYFLDLSTQECLYGIKSRVGIKRDDIPWVEEELDDEFEKYVLEFKEKTAKDIEVILKNYREKKIITFHNRGN